MSCLRRYLSYSISEQNEYPGVEFSLLAVSESTVTGDDSSGFSVYLPSVALNEISSSSLSA